MSLSLYNDFFCLSVIFVVNATVIAINELCVHRDLMLIAFSNILLV
jgi:hypothetical protein